jgi:hypothetical protein
MKALVTLLLAVVVLSTVVLSSHADKYRQELTSRQRNMKYKGVKGKSKAPVKSKGAKKPKSSAKKSKSKKGPSECSSNCFNDTESDAFVAALTTASNYNTSFPLVLNICANATISIPNGTEIDYNYHINLTNPDSDSSCADYSLVINCCDGQNNCVLDYYGETPTEGYGLFDFATTSDPGATLALALNGITMSSSPNSLGIFFEMPEYDNVTFPNCFSSASGTYFKTDPLTVSIPIFFNIPF